MKLVKSIVLCLVVAVVMVSCGDDDGDGIDSNLFWHMDQGMYRLERLQ